jgi:general secretion pathway protein C
MRLTLDPLRARMLRATPRHFPYHWVEVALVAVLAIQSARLIWIAFAPIGPVGDWKGGPSISAGDNADMLKSFDPFFRMTGQSETTVVTSLPLKLYGVRVDQATGRGSAIIATSDGVQQSFVVGDEIMPGIRLKAVARDNVTIDRGGAAEQLFLDQSVAAPVAQVAPVGPAGGFGMGLSGAAPAPGTQSSPAMPSPGMGAGSRGMDHPRAPDAAPSTIAPLQTNIAFAPRMDKGVVTGFAVAPKGAGEAFGAAGFLPGDVVTRINGAGFDSVQGAATALSNIPAGTPVSFSVERAGKTITLNTKTGQ